MAYEHEHFIDKTKSVWNYSLFNAHITAAFAAGSLFTAHEYFGSKALVVDGIPGYYFAVWAPNATEVSVVGAFNGWKKRLHKMYVRQDSSGIWEGFIPNLPDGTAYKYFIKGHEDREVFKADPYARRSTLRPDTASLTYNTGYHWEDDQWLKERNKRNGFQAPWSVYEVHLGSWMRPDKDKPNLFNNYDEIRERLVPYVKAMGFTHVEFMPVTEYPYDGSWGYQCTGFFAATARHGAPEDLKRLINAFHENGIGVILDWVPSHFPGDEHGLYLFDGNHTYESWDMRRGFHKDWNSYIFNYGRGEVCSFLLSSAYYWLKEFHADGLRVDAVNSILRLDFSRAEGEWEPNEHGGNENLEAIKFLQDFNTMVYHEFSGVQTIAEEASDWPKITHPIAKGGLGFGMKWMMGWMHDMFRYMKKEWPERGNAQDDFTFSIMYAYDEKFMLPLSHDEVVHGKSPMIFKMPGTEFQQFSNLKMLYTWMYLHPGAKLLFMGDEFGQTEEWNYDSELQWELLQYESHNGLQECVRALNHIYRDNPAVHKAQFEKKGFKWEDLNHRDEGVMVFSRRAPKVKEHLLVILNVSTNRYIQKEITVSLPGPWIEIFNSDAKAFWGSDHNLNPDILSKHVDKKKNLYKIKVNLGPLSAVVFRAL